MKNSNEKKIIGFDLDGVIINHAPAKVKLAKRFGLKLKLAQTQSEVIKTLIDDKTLKQIQKHLYHDSEFLKSISLMRGAKTGLLKLKNKNLPFVLISRRSEPEMAVAALKYHKLWPGFFNDKNAFFVAEPEEKNMKAREIGVTHYVDDETGVLEKLVDVENCFLFDNLGVFKNTDSYIRVKSWKELIEHFLK